MCANTTAKYNMSIIVLYMIFIVSFLYDKHYDIIGHFGLGFYSSFMVASKVEITFALTFAAAAISFLIERII